MELAAGIVAGSIPLLDGCRRLAALGHRVGVSDDDPDFRMFSLIESETDALPIGPIRKEWAPDALAELAPELLRADAWARPMALCACQSVIARFGP
ncbi:DUF2489 domain-containing protein [Xanthomonas sp. NCPPB 1128]|uniref:DUF2489 domain-containing protein n=1 Tax=Xanthomonas sp. NCPPB 1128 TaxID=1775876 RepID=UPI00103DB630|nr:DUF2489 domain-containing protein [Xanthomonas sp. NCPPB 1128]